MSKAQDIMESFHANEPCPKCGSHHENVDYDESVDKLRRKCAVCGYTRFVAPLDAKRVELGFIGEQDFVLVPKAGGRRKQKRATKH